MSSSIFLFSTGLLYSLFVILFSKNAICSRLKNETGLSVNFMDLYGTLSTSIFNETINHPFTSTGKEIINTDVFCTFKNLIKKVFKRSDKVFLDLEKYTAFQDELIRKLKRLMKKSSVESKSGTSDDSLCFK
ncbi:hypothetical protein NBO_608g0001 [Nosema bombycis CQ1]|uniref:Uncharacterized protein n=1 Tax=Nosema bombycis (strain CQ1 / CVCC 102059) TaxID=578461 RepID=R0KP70_NOSB1|nr:hypothetical protein NBO_608g0001 [Nosema bombycis CQ1]|eukprot:EOB11977.1 hypothetical protein NBO_608g0001 [Nosema bombycis CQ1]